MLLVLLLQLGVLLVLLHVDDELVRRVDTNSETGPTSEDVQRASLRVVGFAPQFAREPVGIERYCVDVSHTYRVMASFEWT